MARKFTKLTRPKARKLQVGDKLIDHGIVFERLRDGDGRYSINIMVDGQRVHRVIGRESEGVTRNQAEISIQNIRTDARRGRLNLPKGRKLTLGFRQASEKYLCKLVEEGGNDIAKKRQRTELHLQLFFRDKPLAKVTSFDVERYKKHRQTEKATNGTINRELAVLSHFFTKAVEWDWIDHKPATIKRLKEDEGRITYLTNQQIQRLLKASIKDESPHIYPFIMIGLATSMRRSEILSIRIENIDLDRRGIFVPHAKTGTRETPITAHLAEFLRSYLETAYDDQVWLFPSSKSKTGHVVNIEKPWRRVVEAAGLDPNQVVRHTLRHTAITHLVQAGVDLPTVKRISATKR